MIRSPSDNPQSNPHAKRNSAARHPQISYEDFVLIIPAIREHARISFRKKRPEEKAELIEECLANAFRAYARLMELGKQDVIYPSVLAKFAVKQVAVIGCPQIQLIDFDTVDPTNVTTQDYLSSDTHDWGQGRR
jgi:hypothetical protein